MLMEAKKECLSNEEKNNHALLIKGLLRKHFSKGTTLPLLYGRYHRYMQETQSKETDERGSNPFYLEKLSYEEVEDFIKNNPELFITKEQKVKFGTWKIIKPKASP